MPNSFHVAKLLTVAIAFAGSHARGETVALAPSQDATIIQWSAGAPEPNPPLANGQGDIYVGRTNQDGQEDPTISIRRGLIQFELTSAVPAGSKLVGASLMIREVRGRNGDPTVTLHRVLSTWTEGGSFFQGGLGAPALHGDVTWLHSSFNAAAPSMSIFWNTPGGDFAAIASASAVISDDGGEGQLFSWSSPALLADIQSWLAAPHHNFGWLLLGDENRGESAKRFNSRESIDAPNVPPLLTLEFVPILAGDFNDDGAVDARDYTVWRDHLGGGAVLANETVTLGSVTADDYDAWKANFGATAQTVRIGAISVPEPTTVTNLLIAVGSVVSCFHRLTYNFGAAS